MLQIPTMIGMIFGQAIREDLLQIACIDTMTSGVFVFVFITLMVIAMEVTWSIKNKGRLK